MSKPWIAPDLQALLDTLPDVAVLALTLFGEARSEPIEGQVAVADVIRQRAKDASERWPQTLRAVCLQPWQFSVWNVAGGELNHERLTDIAKALAAGRDPKNQAFEECAFVATGIVKGAIRQRVRANHYHHLRIERPKWAENQPIAARIGSHLFYHL